MTLKNFDAQYLAILKLVPLPILAVCLLDFLLRLRAETRRDGGVTMEVSLGLFEKATQEPSLESI